MTAGTARDDYFRRIVEGTIGLGSHRVPAVKLALKPESIDSMGAPRSMSLHPKPRTDTYAQTASLSEGGSSEGDLQSAPKGDPRPAEAKYTAEPSQRQVVTRDDKSIPSSLDFKLPESDGNEKDVNVDSAYEKSQERSFAISKSQNKTSINSQRDELETRHYLDSIKDDSPKYSVGAMNGKERTEFSSLDQGDRSRRSAFDGRRGGNDTSSNSQVAAPGKAGAPSSMPSKGGEETTLRVDPDDKITGGKLQAALPAPAVRNLRRDEDAFLQESLYARLAEQSDMDAKSASANFVSVTAARPAYVEYKKGDFHEKATETIVTVNIRRIEIRTPPAPPKQAEHSVSTPAFSPSLSLAEYLRRRNAKK